MMREKRRYILVEANSDVRDMDNFEHELNKEIMDVVGQINFHKVNPRVIEFIDGRRFIIKVGLQGYEDAILAFSMMKRLGGSDIAFYTLRSSGTLEALRKYIDDVKKDIQD